MVVFLFLFSFPLSEKEQTAPAAVLPPALFFCDESCPDQVIDSLIHRPGRRLQFFRNRADGRVALSIFPKPPEKPPLFLPHFIPSHPILESSHLLDGRENLRTALPGGVNRARGLPKATRPLTCIQFDPALQPRFALTFLTPALYQSSFLEAPLWLPDPSISEVLGYTLPNRPNVAFYFHWGIECHPCLENGTRGLTAAHRWRMSCSSFPAFCQICTKPSQQRNPSLFSVNISMPAFTGVCFIPAPN